MPISGNQIINVKVTYKWMEEKTVPIGSRTLTITNPIPIGAKIRIHDKTYGQEWFEGIHWTRSGSTITFTETSFTEVFVFQIYCFVAS